MTVYGPWIFSDGEITEGGIVIERGGVRILDGHPGKVDVRCVVLPPMANAHTHLGDAFIREVPKGTVEEIVAPPNGFKFKMLKKASNDAIVRGMSGAVGEMERSGTGIFADFRENGIDGVRALRDALKGHDIGSIILARPKSLSYGAKEIDKLLRAADGIGLSSISEWKRSDLDAMSGQCRRAGKPFAIHASERAREPFGDVASLEPAFVVHMIEATARDLRDCAGLEIPVVVCPRSNAFFGTRPPMERMLAAGITIALGTDNAMLARPNIWEEMRYIRMNWRRVPEAEILRMGLANGWEIFGKNPWDSLRKGSTGSFPIIECDGIDPPKDLLICKIKVISLKR
ncbi:MAG: amidohydrolase family protein [Euryarchaeota archaeon]|nr:amidohydrolase family protein [Euryarchaeota archaeon]